MTTTTLPNVSPGTIRPAVASCVLMLLPNYSCEVTGEPYGGATVPHLKSEHTVEWLRRARQSLQVSTEVRLLAKPSTFQLSHVGGISEISQSGEFQLALDKGAARYTIPCYAGAQTSKLNQNPVSLRPDPKESPGKAHPRVLGDAAVFFPLLHPHGYISMSLRSMRTTVHRA